MRRRTSLGILATVAASPLSALAGCGAPPLPVTRPLAPVTDALVLRPARSLAVHLEDLPDGFRLAEESTPILVTTPAEDPWGRVGAYSATYVATESSPAGVHDIVSSVNAYTTAQRAKDAFALWQSAVPASYQLLDDIRSSLDPAGGRGESAVYTNANACLAGVRISNVLASVWVGLPRGKTLPPERRGEAQEYALRLARLTAQRIDRAIRS